MSQTATGTMVGRNSRHLEFVAPANSCFPYEIEGQDSDLRIKDHTHLPVQNKFINVTADLYLKFFEKLKVGAPSLRAGTKINKTSRIECFFEGAQAEMMNHINLTNYYRTSMPEVCKEYLNLEIAFIIQTIKIEKMHFTFYDEFDGRVFLSLDNIEEFLDIQADIKWHIENQFTLIIDSPKYIGYQLGLLKENDQGLALWRAKKVRFGKPVFKKITGPSNKITRDYLSKTYDQTPDLNAPIPIEAIFE